MLIFSVMFVIFSFINLKKMANYEKTEWSDFCCCS